MVNWTWFRKLPLPSKACSVVNRASLRGGAGTLMSESSPAGLGYGTHHDGTSGEEDRNRTLATPAYIVQRNFTGIDSPGRDATRTAASGALNSSRPRVAG